MHWMRIGNSQHYSQNNNWVQENNEMVKNCGPGILSLNAKTSCSDLFWFGGDRNVDKTNLIFQICFDSEELSGNRWRVINLISSCLCCIKLYMCTYHKKRIRNQVLVQEVGLEFFFKISRIAWLIIMSFSTYITLPCNFVMSRMRFHFTFKVDIVSFFDIWSL